MTKRLTLLTAASTFALMPARAGALNAVLDSIDDLPEDLKKEYTQNAEGKFVLQVAGGKTPDDFNRLQTAHNKEKQDHAALKARIKEHFGEEKFEDIRATLDKVPELEARQGTMDDDKIEQIVQARVKTHVAPVERERDQLKTKVGELEGKVGELTTAEKKRQIKDKAREAGIAAKLLPEAMDDWLMLADNVLELREDDGKVVVKDQVGHTPGVEPSILLTDLQSKRPHWWGPSMGGGAGGNREGNRGAGTNPWTFNAWNMTEQGAIMTSDPQRAEQLAKAAGHKDAATARKPAPPAQ